MIARWKDRDRKICRKIVYKLDISFIRGRSWYSSGQVSESGLLFQQDQYIPMEACACSFDYDLKTYK